jgi:hypothetical protein
MDSLYRCGGYRNMACDLDVKNIWHQSLLTTWTVTGKVPLRRTAPSPERFRQIA